MDVIYLHLLERVAYQNKKHDGIGSANFNGAPYVKEKVSQNLESWRKC